MPTPPLLHWHRRAGVRVPNRWQRLESDSPSQRGGWDRGAAVPGQVQGIGVGRRSQLRGGVVGQLERVGQRVYEGQRRVVAGDRAAQSTTVQRSRPDGRVRRSAKPHGDLGLLA